MALSKTSTTPFRAFIVAVLTSYTTYVVYRSRKNVAKQKYVVQVFAVQRLLSRFIEMKSVEERYFFVWMQVLCLGLWNFTSKYFHILSFSRLVWRWRSPPYPLLMTPVLFFCRFLLSAIGLTLPGIVPLFSPNYFKLPS